MKQCQSCGMPLKTKKGGDRRGTELDGSLSEKWCKLCYGNGEFFEPIHTLDEMKVIIDKILLSQGRNRILRWVAKQQLHTLDRWKKTKKIRV